MHLFAIKQILFIGIGFFDIFRLPPLLSFVVCGPIATKFCTGIDKALAQIWKNLHKINDLIDNDVIIVRRLAEKTVKRV